MVNHFGTAYTNIPSLEAPTNNWDKHIICRYEDKKTSLVSVTTHHKCLLTAMLQFKKKTCHSSLLTMTFYNFNH